MILEVDLGFERLDVADRALPSDQAQGFIASDLKTPRERSIRSPAAPAAPPGASERLLDNLLGIVVTMDHPGRLPRAAFADQRPVPMFDVVLGSHELSLKALRSLKRF
jgi:hypothetical protein